MNLEYRDKVYVPPAPADWELPERLAWRAGYRAAMSTVAELDPDNELEQLRGALLTWKHGKNTEQDDVVVYRAAQILDQLINEKLEPERTPSKLRTVE